MKSIFLLCNNLLGTLALFVLFAGVLVGQDTSGARAPNRFEAGASNAANQQRTERALENIKKAIGVLVPGGIVEGTPRQKKLDAVIESFARRQALDAMQALEAMAAEDPNLPPADIMMAGLTFAVGDNKAGMALLENSAMKYPDYPGVYLSFAQIALNNNRITDASLHADKTARLIESGKHSADQKSHFLKQYYEIATGIYLRRKQNAMASETLEKLQALSPDLPFYFYSKAELAFRADNSQQALAFLEKNAAATQSPRPAALTLVEWHRNAGQLDAAEKQLLQTLEQNPRDGATRMMAAQMFMHKEDFQQALDAIKIFEEINGGQTNQTLDMKGRIAFAGLSYEVAAGHFRNLAQNVPNDPSSANILALCLVESDDPADRNQAQQISQRVAGRMTGNPLALATLGYIFLKNGEPEKSKQLMQRVALSRQATPEISFFLANWLKENGQQQEAIRLLQTAIDSNGLFLYRSASRKLLSELQAEK